MRSRGVVAGAVISLLLIAGMVPAVANKIDVAPAPASAGLLSEAEASRLAVETGQ